MRIIRLLLLLMAVVSLGWVACKAARMHLAQRELRARLEEALERTEGDEAPAGTARLDDPRAPREFGDLVGRIRIPRVDLDVMALEGVRDYLLDEGAGHFHETPLPGHGGNTAFAGHRDTFFKELRHVTPGDSIHVTVPWGEYAYIVDTTLVVDPDDVWVLDQRGREELTLVTCYPFDYLGPAPRRIVISARPAGGKAS